MGGIKPLFAGRPYLRRAVGLLFCGRTLRNGVYCSEFERALCNVETNEYGVLSMTKKKKTAVFWAIPLGFHLEKPLTPWAFREECLEMWAWFGGELQRRLRDYVTT